MNVLLTCAGRRDYMVRYFRKALASTGSTGKVFAANSLPEVSAMMEADQAFVVPALDADNYVDVLLDLCREYDVRLVVPLFDLELPILARNRERFEGEGIDVLVSAESAVKVCHDKWETVQFVEEQGLGAPDTYRTIEAAKTALRHDEVELPLVVKPRFGMGSIGVVIVEDGDDLDALYRYAERRTADTYLASTLGRETGEGLLIQKFIDGPQYGLDVINDLEGNYRACLIKQKVAMRAGETDIGKTESRPSLRALGERLGKTLKHRGVLGADVLVSEETPYIVDLNCRFTGHYPCAHVAGADVPAALLSWVKDESVDSEWLRVRDGVVSIKGLTPMSTGAKEHFVNV